MKYVTFLEKVRDAIADRKCPMYICLASNYVVDTTPFGKIKCFFHHRRLRAAMKTFICIEPTIETSAGYKMRRWALYYVLGMVTHTDPDGMTNKDLLEARVKLLDRMIAMEKRYVVS